MNYLHETCVSIYKSLSVREFVFTVSKINKLLIKSCGHYSVR